MPLPPRLDLVPINRSVGLKAKPTKPVTEVLRPVVAKYGLHLSELVARLVSNLGPGLCPLSPQGHSTCLVWWAEPEGPTHRRPLQFLPARSCGVHFCPHFCPVEWKCLCLFTPHSLLEGFGLILRCGFGARKPE